MEHKQGLQLLAGPRNRICAVARARKMPYAQTLLICLKEYVHNSKLLPEANGYSRVPIHTATFPVPPPLSKQDGHDKLPVGNCPSPW